MSTPAPDNGQLQELGRTAIEAAHAAGAIALHGFRGDLQVRVKGRKDIVTQFDTAAEDAAISLIRGRYPEHGFLAEESGRSRPREGSQPPVEWAIDPIDGTHNYALQLPFWCCSVAAIDTESDRVVAAAVFDPLHGETFSAMAGHGAFLNGEPLHVSREATLDDAALGFDMGYDPAVAAGMLQLAYELRANVNRLRLLGSAALALTYVAAGRLDGYFHMRLQPWDVAAASLLIVEAGGQISDWQGNPIKWVPGSALATNGVLHPALLALLKNHAG